MRRLAGLVCAVLAVTTVVFALRADAPTASDTGRVDAIFPNAGFLIPGQQVKVAGAVVGSVKDVTLTPDTKARIAMEVDQKFLPFKRDADCTIQPQSLIGEKFIDCTPGSADAAPLRAQGDHPPTVPLSNTHAPVDLDLVLAALRQPTTRRLSLMLDALGGGLTGNGVNLNTAIRRAVPALGRTKRLLDEVNGDRRTLQALLTESDRVLAVLGDRRQDVARFVTSAADATQASGERQAQLRATVRNLPALLRQARPALTTLTQLAQDGTPAVRDLRAATPQANALVAQVAPFSRRATPALEGLGDAAREGLRTIPSALPQLRRLTRLSRQLVPFGQLAAPFLRSTRDNGAVEGILNFVYYATVAQARYDNVSHFLPAYPVIKDTCSVYATTTVGSCNANFAGGGRAATARRAPAPKRKGGEATPATTTTGTTTAPAPAAPVAPRLPDVVSDLPNAVGKLVDGLLGGGRDKQGTASDPVTGLLDYLLGGGRR